MAPPATPAKPAVKADKKKDESSAGIRSTLSKFIPNPFKKKENPKTPIKGFAPRIKNMMKNNFRGILGFFVPLIVLTPNIKDAQKPVLVELMWVLMMWCFLIHPVGVPVVGLLPVFILPMTGVISTGKTCSCYMNEFVLLFILTAMVILLLNNSGVDRRIAIWFICSGDACQYSGKRLVFKVSSAAFFLSMFSNRLLIANLITQIMTEALTKLDSTPKGPDDPNFIDMRDIINNAIQTSCAIGGTAILHGSTSFLMLRGAFHEFASKGQEYPDIFNYLQYSAFAFPVAFVMLTLNTVYHMLLMDKVLKKPMSAAKMSELKGILNKYDAELPRKVSLHERLTVLFLIITLCVFFFRHNQWIDGWAEFSRFEAAPQLIKVGDATVAAIFSILLCVIPKSYTFLKIFDAEKKKDLPPLKAESSILWWRFIDRNLNYSYLLIFGATFAVIRAGKSVGLAEMIAENQGTMITSKSWNSGLFICLFFQAVLCNIMTSLGALSTWVPFILFSSLDAAIPWPGKVYCACLGVGITSSFGFSAPFRYTPAYFCHYVGKVPIRKMIKYSFLSVWICMLTVYIALIIWAPFLFDPEDAGIFSIETGAAGEGGETTTQAAPPEPPPP